MEGWKRLTMLERVKAPVLSWKLPTTIFMVGSIRKRSENRRNGRIPSQASDIGRLPPDTCSAGAETILSPADKALRRRFVRICGAVTAPQTRFAVYWTLAPTTLSQPLVTACLLASCSSSEGQTALL